MKPCMDNRNKCHIFRAKKNGFKPLANLGVSVPSSTSKAKVSTVFSKRETATRPPRSGVREKCLEKKLIFF